MSKTSPTQRTLAWCRDNKLTAAVTEKWNPHARIRQDLFGFIDLIYLDGSKIVAVQTTSGSNAAARVKKIAAEPRAREWLGSPHRMIVVHAWRKIKGGGKRATWQLREDWVTVDELDAPTTKGIE